MGMRATVIQYYINVRTPKKEKGRTKLEQEQIWNGFKMFRAKEGRATEGYATKHITGKGACCGWTKPPYGTRTKSFPGGGGG